MDNEHIVLPYSEKIVTLGEISSFTSTYDPDDLILSNISSAYHDAYGYYTADQGLFPINSTATVDEMLPNLFNASATMINSLVFVGSTPPDEDKTLLFSIPFVDDNGVRVFYIICKIYAASAYVYEGTDGDWKYSYRSQFIECGTSFDGVNFATGTGAVQFFTLGGSAAYHWENQYTSPMTIHECSVNVYSSIGEIDGHQCISFGVQNSSWTRYNSSVFTWNSPTTLKYLDLDWIADQFGAKLDMEIWSDSFGPASEEEGYTGGSFDDTSDLIDIPNMPAEGISGAGFLNLYKITGGQLANFGGELFPNFNGVNITPVPQTPADIPEAIVNFSVTLAEIGSNIGPLIDMYINKSLIDYVIDCHIIPVAPTVSSADNIRVGWKQFATTAAVVTSDYVDFDCGTLEIAEYYKNFVDYLTTAQLFLPFIGFVPMQPEFWQGGTLGVKYRFNVVDGSFQAFVTSYSSKSNLAGSVVAQYGGSCIVHIPITGLNYSNLVGSLINAGVSVATAGGSSAMSAITGVAAGTESLLEGVNPALQQSNSYNASTAFLSVRRPYLLIERPVQQTSAMYYQEMGLPLNVAKKLAKLDGFTVCENPIMSGFDGFTDEEVAEIKNLLTSGVILTYDADFE